MTNRYSEEENKAWLARQPKKMVVVKAIIKSEKDDVLLLKSAYKDSWQLPGGGVDTGESPEIALQREIREETGLLLTLKDLTVVGTIYKQDEEMVFLIYEYAQRLKESVKITLDTSEAESYSFIHPNMVASNLSPYYKSFWDHYINE
jgi:ADP-ribose pyrophosphatase YjhB (NUDIX family)